MGEIMSAQSEYREPWPSDYITVETGEFGARALAELTTNYRVSRVDGDVVVREPRQDGVLRYPPVQVEVKRDAEQVERYIKMPPTDLSFWRDNSLTE